MVSMKDIARACGVSVATVSKALNGQPDIGEETRAIADELLKIHTIVLNLENTNSDSARRIIDFLSGVAYANNGQINRVANSTFIITPFNVDIMGDLLDELESNGVFF